MNVMEKGGKGTRRIAAAAAVAIVLAAGLPASPARAGCRCGLKVQPLDVAFVFDSTGSMGGPIRSVKLRIQRMIEILRENVPGLRVGMVTYRDYSDRPYQRKGIDLTKDYARVIKFMKGVEASGGGDHPEAVELGLSMAIRDFAWGGGSRKVIVLIGDAPPHHKKKRFCVTLAKQARARGITIHTVTTAATAPLPSFRDIAREGGGEAVMLRGGDALVKKLLSFSLGYAFGDDERLKRPRKREMARETKPRQPRRARAESHRLRLARLVHKGHWDVPHAAGKLLGALRTRERLDFAPTTADITLDHPNLFEYPMLYVSGHRAMELTDREKRRLKIYIERGGFVLADACCGRKAFDKDFRALLKGLFPTVPLRRLATDHDVFRTARPKPTVRMSKVSRSGRIETVATHLEGLTLDGRLAVVYSPFDLGCEWTRGPGVTCQVAEGHAYEVTLNMILYGLTR